MSNVKNSVGKVRKYGPNKPFKTSTWIEGVIKKKKDTYSKDFFVVGVTESEGNLILDLADESGYVTCYQPVEETTEFREELKKLFLKKVKLNITPCNDSNIECTELRISVQENHIYSYYLHKNDSVFACRSESFQPEIGKTYSFELVF